MDPFGRAVDKRAFASGRASRAKTSPRRPDSAPLRVRRGRDLSKLQLPRQHPWKRVRSENVPRALRRLLTHRLDAGRCGRAYASSPVATLVPPLQPPAKCFVLGSPCPIRAQCPDFCLEFDLVARERGRIPQASRAVSYSALIAEESGLGPQALPVSARAT